MVRIGVIGDTQGRYRVDALLAEVTWRFQGVDEVWHAGDWQVPEVLEGLNRIAPVTAVNGNAPDDRHYPERIVRELEGLKIGMVHRPPRPGDEWAASLDVCIHGHTHRWRDEVIGRTRFINVSTPTAAPFSSDRTIGLLSLDQGRAELLKLLL